MKPKTAWLTAALLVPLAAGALTACGSIDSALDKEIMTSIQYDDYSCAKLVSLRNREAARFDLPRDAERDQSRSIKWRSALMPLGAFAPDLRGEKARERGLARGRIDAMNRSLARRCDGSKPRKPG